MLPVVVRALDEAEVAVEDIVLRRPTLDKVFLARPGTRPTRQRRRGNGGDNNDNDTDTSPQEDAA